MTIRGYTPPPNPQNFKSNFKLRSAQKAHDQFVQKAERGWNGKGNPLLKHASYVRNYSGVADEYKRPMEYVTDLWTDGFLNNEQASALAEEFKTKGKAGALMKAFLQEQKDLGHLHYSEQTAMFAYEEKHLQSNQSAAQKTSIRQSVLNSVREQLSNPAEALIIAADVQDELQKDPFESALKKISREAQPNQNVTAPVDLGELTAVRTDGFADREAARAAARAEGKSPQR